MPKCFAVVTLVTGPVRSGKSRFVVQLASHCSGAVTYVATAIRATDDDEWNARLQRHVSDRPAHWKTIETAELGHDALLEIFRSGSSGDCIVVDAIGTWIAARIATHLDALAHDFAAFEEQMDREADEIAAAMLACPSDVLVITEEVGWDIVPVAVSARLFRDVLGRMKQRLAAEAENVYLLVCGYALDLKASGVSI